MTTETKAKLADLDAGEKKLIRLIADKTNARLAALTSIKEIDNKIVVLKAALKSLNKERKKLQKK